MKVTVDDNNSSVYSPHTVTDVYRAGHLSLIPNGEMDICLYYYFVLYYLVTVLFLLQKAAINNTKIERLFM